MVGSDRPSAASPTIVLMLRRWRWRQRRGKDDRIFIERIRTESDPKQNEQLRDSYDKHPLRLAAIIVGDIFVDGEIEVLWSALRGPLGPDRPGAEDASRVSDFLRRSASRTLGGAALGAIRFHRPGQHRMAFGSHEMPLPVGIEQLSLHMYQFAPGMVMAAIVASMSSSTAEKVFTNRTPAPSPANPMAESVSGLLRPQRVPISSVSSEQLPKLDYCRRTPAFWVTTDTQPDVWLPGPDQRRRMMAPVRGATSDRSLESRLGNGGRARICAFTPAYPSPHANSTSVVADTRC